MASNYKKVSKPKGSYSKDRGSVYKWLFANPAATARKYGAAAGQRAQANLSYAARIYSQDRQGGGGGLSNMPIASNSQILGNQGGGGSGYYRSSYRPYSRSYGGYSYGYGGGGGGAPLTTTSTDTRTTTVGPQEARARVFSVMQELLGRNALPAEQSLLEQALKAYEQANPTVTTTTSTKSADGASDTSTTTVSEGASDAGRQQAIKEKAMSSFDKERFSYQAATTYMDALMKAIDNPFAEG